MSQDILIGIDLGASIVRAGAFNPLGELIDVRQSEIRAIEGPQTGMQRILSLVEETLAGLPEKTGAPARLLGIGVGSTGPTDSARGYLVNPLTMPGWLNVPVVPDLEARFDVPACLENDADAAALGEYWQGAGRSTAPGEPPVRRLYMITVGTGIGTAFIQDGQVYRGAGGFHPEGGHQVVDPGGPLCYCGGRGCWESMSSGTAIGKAARQALREAAADHRGEEGRLLLELAGGDLEAVDAVLTAEAARQGDPLAVRVIERAAYAFALGVFNILMLFYPDRVVLSGGVMRSIDLFMPAIRSTLAEADRYVPIQRMHIEPARLGYYAGIYGAAYAILQSLGQATSEQATRQLGNQ